MSTLPPNPSGREPGGEFPKQRRPLRWVGLTLLALVLLFGGWLGFAALSAKSNLERSRNSAQLVKEALVKGDTGEAVQQAANALSQAKSAQSTMHSLPWTLATSAPLVGGPFTASQKISDVVVGLATDILQPAAAAGVELSPSKLYQDGRVDLARLRAQEPTLVELAASAQRLDAQASAIPPARFVAPIDNARQQLRGQTSEMTSLLHNTALASQIGPSMMGADGPRAYLMAFQTNAEARGTGGLLGGFGILRFTDGKPTVDAVAPNTELLGATSSIDLGPEFNEIYRPTRSFTDVRNSNQSAHFPYAAQIWRSMVESQTGTKLDGVIAVDPVALSYILGAEGSITLPDGQVVTQDNVVELTESTTYIKFPVDQKARKEYLQDIANAVVRKITGQVQSPGKLLNALGRAASERRLSVWSAFPAEQKVLEGTVLGHIIPDDTAPMAQVVINNFGGNKMDYYLRREIEYVADGCQGDMRNSTVTVRLTNTLKDTSNLPEYISGGMGLPPDLPFKVPPGSMVSSVRLLATHGAELQSVTSNGERILPIVTNERGHPSYEVQVVIPAGQSGELTFQLSEPTAKGEARVPVQPLIDDVTPTVSVPTC